MRLRTDALRDSMRAPMPTLAQKNTEREQLTPAEIRLAAEYGTYTEFADRIGLQGEARARAVKADEVNKKIPEQAA